MLLPIGLLKINCKIITEQIIRFVEIQIEKISSVLSERPLRAFKSGNVHGLVQELVNQVLLVVTSALPIILRIVPPVKKNKKNQKIWQICMVVASDPTC